MKQTHLSHQFVEFIPERIEEGTLYISRRYRTAAHKCCCGCGQEVITPFTPTDWTLWLDGNVVTLHPSIGNWSFACRSHYWIRKSNVVWAGQMSQQKIELGRAMDRATKKAYFNAVNSNKGFYSRLTPNEDPSQNEGRGLFHHLWSALKRWWA